MNLLFLGIDFEIVRGITSALILFQSDWRVSTINSGMECLDIVRKGNCPDVIIMNMHLDDMSGLELVCCIRDDSDVPIVIISGDNDEKALVSAFDAGVDVYIASPLKETIFAARLNALKRRLDWHKQANKNYLNTENNGKYI